VAPGGLLGWEALTAEARRARPGLSPDWRKPVTRMT